MKKHCIYFESHSSFFFESLTWRIVKSSISNLSLPRRFNLIQVCTKIGKLVQKQIVNQALLGEIKSVDSWCKCLKCNQIPKTKECLCCHELDACNYFKIKGLYIYLLTILQIFFIKLINEHIVL